MSRSVDDEEHRFAYLSRPHEAIGIASIYELPARTDAELASLVGVGDPARPDP